LVADNKGFVSRSFIFFEKPVEFGLLAAFVPETKSTDYDLTNEQTHLKIISKGPLLLYVK
jgi:hypothetical protein